MPIELAVGIFVGVQLQFGLHAFAAQPEAVFEALRVPVGAGTRGIGFEHQIVEPRQPAFEQLAHRLRSGQADAGDEGVDGRIAAGQRTQVGCQASRIDGLAVEQAVPDETGVVGHRVGRVWQRRSIGAEQAIDGVDQASRAQHAHQVLPGLRVQLGMHCQYRLGLDHRLDRWCTGQIPRGDGSVRVHQPGHRNAEQAQIGADR